VAVQSVAFSRNTSPGSVNSGRGWTSEEARAWLRRNGFLAPKEDVTRNQLRFRQFAPGLCDPDSFSTLTEDVPAGVQLIDCDREE